MRRLTLAAACVASALIASSAVGWSQTAQINPALKPDRMTITDDNPAVMANRVKSLESQVAALTRTLESETANRARAVEKVQNEVTVFRANYDKHKHMDSGGDQLCVHDIMVDGKQARVVMQPVGEKYCFRVSTVANGPIEKGGPYPKSGT